MTKKLVCLVLVLIMLVLVFAGCNQQIIDTTYEFDRCIIKLPDGKIITGAVEGWKDWDGDDAILIKVNGKTYYTHMSNVVLIAD